MIFLNITSISVLKPIRSHFSHKAQSLVFQRTVDLSWKLHSRWQKLLTGMVSFIQMKGYTQQQDETNGRILREIDEMKKQKKSAEDHSLLMPRSLDFTIPPSTVQHSKASSFQYQGSQACSMDH
ncbi:hypothetical protein HanPI659440_Chr13g0501271 [Helianthus annuus]|nr:hypothetical protein HanPI659440_Chr13g0501271 [Helianthus annuus]